jgi:hypothetical protein
MEDKEVIDNGQKLYLFGKTLEIEHSSALLSRLFLYDRPL